MFISFSWKISKIENRDGEQRWHMCQVRYMHFKSLLQSIPVCGGADIDFPRHAAGLKFVSQSDIVSKQAIPGHLHTDNSSKHWPRMQSNSHLKAKRQCPRSLLSHLPPASFACVSQLCFQSVTISTALLSSLNAPVNHHCSYKATSGELSQRSHPLTLL